RRRTAQAACRRRAETPGRSLPAKGPGRDLPKEEPDEEGPDSPRRAWARRRARLPESRRVRPPAGEACADHRPEEGPGTARQAAAPGRDLPEGEPDNPRRARAHHRARCREVEAVPRVDRRGPGPPGHAEGRTTRADTWGPSYLSEISVSRTSGNVVLSAEAAARGPGPQKRVSGSVGVTGSGNGSTSGRRARTSSWKRRARVSASALSGVWMNTVGERPSRSQPTTVSSHGFQPSTVRSASSLPR